MAIQLVVYGIIQAIHGVVFCLSLVWVLFVSGALILDMFNDGAIKALKEAKDLYRDRRQLVLCLASLAALALFPFTLAAVCTSLATSLGILLRLAVVWPPPQDEREVGFVLLCASLAAPLGIMLIWAYQHPDAAWAPLITLLSLVMTVLAPFWALAMFPFRVLAAIWTFVTFPIRVLAAFEAFGQGLILAVFEAIFLRPTTFFAKICHDLAALSAFQILAAFLTLSAVLVVSSFSRYLIIRTIRLHRWKTRKAGKYSSADERRLVSNCPANPWPASITTQCCSTHNAREQGRQAAVVLTEFEAKFPCGSFTINELRYELRRFWCDWQDDAFDLCWLQYFINSDSPFGFVYAWAGAVMAHHDSLLPNGFLWRPDDFDPSLTCCAYDDRAEFIKTKEDQDLEFIYNASSSANPRRVWDIASNKVIPGAWIRRSFGGKVRIWAISHAWAPENERRHIWTSVNNYQWPVPIPKDITLENLRGDLIGLGCRYAWLDVLCLRQEYPEDEREKMHSLQEFERREQLRITEWKIDVPTIGFLYCAPSPVIIYFNRLGKPFEPRDWKLDHKNHWLNRAWTLQEAVDLDRISVGGRRDSTTPIEDLFNTQIDGTITISQRLQYLLSLKNETTSKMVLMTEMGKRHATNYLDKVVGLMAILSPNIRELPIYKQTETPQEAWNGWMHRIYTASKNSPEFTFAHQLVTLFPHPSKDYWFPSWDQVIKFPSVSLRERNQINRRAPQPPINKILFPFQLGGLICNSTLYESCRLRKSENTYEASYGELEVPLFSTLEDESLPNVGIEDSRRYALVDITVPQNALPNWLNWMSGCRLLLVCQELGRIEVEPNDLKDPCYKPCTCVWSRKEVIRLRRITTLMFRPTAFHPKVPFLRRAKHIVPDGTCVGPLFSLE